MRLLGSLTQPATHLAVDIRHADVATGMTYGGLVSRPGQIWIWAWWCHRGGESGPGLVTVGTTFFFEKPVFFPRPQPVPRFCTPVCFPPYHWLGTGSLIRRHEPRASSQLAKSRASSHPGSKSKSPVQGTILTPGKSCTFPLMVLMSVNQHV